MVPAPRDQRAYPSGVAVGVGSREIQRNLSAGLDASILPNEETPFALVDALMNVLAFCGQFVGSELHSDRVNWCVSFTRC